MVDSLPLRHLCFAPRTLDFSQAALFQEVMLELVHLTDERATTGRVGTENPQFPEAGSARVQGLDFFPLERAAVHGTDPLSPGDLLIAGRAEYVAAGEDSLRGRRHDATRRAYERFGNFVDKFQRAPVQEFVDARQLSLGGTHWRKAMTTSEAG